MARRNQGARLQWLDKRGCYYIVWSENGRSKQRSTGTTDREVAEVKLAEFLAERGHTGGPLTPNAMLISDALAYYALVRKETATAADRIGFAIPPLIEFWGNGTVSEITQERCHAYRRWRQRSDGTVRRELGVLRAAIRLAKEDRKLSDAPDVKLPDAPEGRSRWLTRDEAARLLRAARSSPKARLHLPLFILMGLYTGKRSEAILSLRWPQVDLEARRIDFNPPGRARTKKQRPNSVIPRRLLPHLIRARRRGTDLGYVIHIGGKQVKSVKRAFASACERAGLEDVTPHTLRHTCATWLMQKGVKRFEVAGYLGMSEQTLERVYGHHHPEYQQAVERAF